MYPIAEFIREIPGIEHSADPAAIAFKSRDRYAVSPLLKRMLDGKRADIVVSPKTLGELREIVRAAVRHRIPITSRGGGTANYGQSVPLRGGILLDMTGYAGIVKLEPGFARVKGGTIISDIDEAARKIGWEMRIVPTTKRQATVAGHIAGGQGGPGSAAYGTLRCRGNILAAQIMTMEDEPRILELRGRDAQLVHHTYGATGIITELEMPLVPAWPWIEAVVAFPTHNAAVAFGVELLKSTGLIRKVVSVQEWPTPRLFRAFGDIVPEGHSIVSTMIAAQCWEDFEDFVAAEGGTIAAKAREGEGSYGAPLTEFVFGHALLQIRKSEPRRTGLEGFYRGPDIVELVARVRDAVGAYGPLRVELMYLDGEIVGSGSPFFIYESPEQMAEIVRKMQAAGALVANSHTSNVRSVGKKEIRPRDIAFKRTVDPYGLLNPGRFEADGAADEDFTLKLPTDSWERRLA